MRKGSGTQTSASGLKYTGEWDNDKVSVGFFSFEILKKNISISETVLSTKALLDWKSVAHWSFSQSCDLFYAFISVLSALRSKMHSLNMFLVIMSWLLLLWPADEWQRNSYTPIGSNLQWPVQRRHVSRQRNLHIYRWDKIRWNLQQQQVIQYKISPWSQWQPSFICKVGIGITHYFHEKSLKINIKKMFLQIRRWRGVHRFTRTCVDWEVP